MCNINIIMNLKGTKSTKITEAMNVVSYNSYLGNDDAEGWYADDFKVKKSVEKQIMTGKHSFIVSHQRRSTSGKNAKMSQPLETKNFILVHNGIFSGLGNEKESDTYEYLMNLEEKYKSLQDTKAAIKQLNSETGGYYSVVIYNKKTKEFYYYKDTTSTMYFIKSNTWLVMSTNKHNVEYLKKYFNIKEDLAEVDPKNIYDLNNKFKIVGTFEMKVYKPVQTTHTSSYWNDWANRASRQNLTRDKIIKVLHGMGIQPVTVGLHSGYVMLGLVLEDLTDFKDMFPEAVFVKTKEGQPNKEDRYLYTLEANEIMDMIDDMEEW